MKSIERRFLKIWEKYPYFSSATAFYFAIAGQEFSDRCVSLWFDRLVDKDDYDPKNKREIVKDLQCHSNIKSEVNKKYQKVTEE